MTTKRKVNLHSIHAMNTDVDKTSYAIDLTKRISVGNSKTLFVDCNMYSSSLTLKYQLKAPKQDLHPTNNPDNSFYSSTDTADSIVERLNFFKKEEMYNTSYLSYAKSSESFLTFFNDAMNYLRGNADSDESIVFETKSYFWRHSNSSYKNVYFLPSSPLENDVKQSFEWDMGDPFDWLHSLTKLLYFTLKQNEDIENIVFDMNYGSINFAHEIMLLLDLLHRKNKMPEGYHNLYELNIDFQCKQHIVMNEKLQNLLPAFEYCKNKKMRADNGCDIIPVKLETFDEQRYADLEEVRNDAFIIESVEGLQSFIDSVQSY